VSKVALAIKYRPKTWEDVTEQGAVKVILDEQLKTNTFKNAYLFCGSAGTGKTTCARIFANEINKGKGNPIEMDAASNSGVDDVREIINQAKTKSLTSEYKVFIVDECHSLSNTAWQAMLKLIEEPPAKSIFVFCTTDPQKIPKTILSRVQRYEFKRISQKGIVERLRYICTAEVNDEHDIGFMCNYTNEALEYLARLSEGGMRDAITLMDKCLSYSTDLTVDNITKALGVTGYGIFYDLTFNFIKKDQSAIIRIVEEEHNAGKDLKQFCKQYLAYILDYIKYASTKTMEYCSVPPTEQGNFDELRTVKFDAVSLLDMLVKLNADIKWSQSAKYDIEAAFMLEVLK